MGRHEHLVVETEDRAVERRLLPPELRPRGRQRLEGVECTLDPDLERDRLAFLLVSPLDVW
jgi:hypothetical protein